MAVWATSTHSSSGRRWVLQGFMYCCWTGPNEALFVYHPGLLCLTGSLSMPGCCSNCTACCVVFCLQANIACAHQPCLHCAWFAEAHDADIAQGAYASALLTPGSNVK